MNSGSSTGSAGAVRGARAHNNTNSSSELLCHL